MHVDGSPKDELSLQGIKVRRKSLVGRMIRPRVITAVRYFHIHEEPFCFSFRVWLHRPGHSERELMPLSLPKSSAVSQATKPFPRASPSGTNAPMLVEFLAQCIPRQTLSQLLPTYSASIWPQLVNIAKISRPKKRFPGCRDVRLF
jgi:hypothetical protein